MSTYCPSPVRSRAKRAATIAEAANIPAAMSAIGTPSRVGGPPTGPVMLIIPLTPWTIRSYAVRW